MLIGDNFLLSFLKNDTLNVDNKFIPASYKVVVRVVHFLEYESFTTSNNLTIKLRCTNLSSVSS